MWIRCTRKNSKRWTLATRLITLSTIFYNFNSLIFCFHNEEETKTYSDTKKKPNGRHPSPRKKVDYLLLPVRSLYILNVQYNEKWKIAFIKLGNLPSPMTPQKSYTFQKSVFLSSSSRLQVNKSHGYLIQTICSEYLLQRSVFHFFCSLVNSCSTLQHVLFSFTYTVGRL